MLLSCPRRQRASERTTFSRDDAARLVVIRVHFEVEHLARCEGHETFANEHVKLLNEWTTILWLSLFPVMMPRLGNVLGKYVTLPGNRRQ